MVTDENDEVQVAARAAWEAARLRQAKVVVDTRAAPRAATAEEREAAEYREPTAMVDSDDDEIKALASRALVRRR